MASFVFNWTLLCVAIGIVFYFLGQPSGVFYMLGVEQSGAKDISGAPVYGGKPLDQGQFVRSLGEMLFNPTTMLLLLGIAGVGLVAGAAGLLQQATSFAAIYLVPLFMYLFIMNFVAMPWSMFFVNSSCDSTAIAAGTLTPEAAAACEAGSVPDTIKWPLLLLFNFFTVWAAVTFIRGG